VQGEFGIGLLSFWTVGDTLTMTSTGSDQRAYQMTMTKGDPRYSVSPRRVLFADAGTELRISPLLVSPFRTTSRSGSRASCRPRCTAT
jgi:HSP90 family molecular chaperone